jgi:hypothetical protein
MNSFNPPISAPISLSLEILQLAFVLPAPGEVFSHLA